MNLLPKTEKDNIKKGLKRRFAIVSMILLSAASLIGLVMFLPSYFLASSYLSKDASGGYLSESKDSDSVKEIMNLPIEIKSKLIFFQSNTDSISVADILSKIVSFLPKGVKLYSMSFSNNQNYNEKKGTLILISGISSDRDSLINFSSLLEKSDLFSIVEVPVSSLTKERDLPFSMNIFIENKK